MKVTFFLIFVIYSFSAFSHKCILKDTTSKEITIYNSCLSQQKNNDTSINLNKSLIKKRILEFKNENLRLKNKLIDLQNKLRNLSKLIENYANL